MMACFILIFHMKRSTARLPGMEYVTFGFKVTNDTAIILASWFNATSSD